VARDREPHDPGAHDHHIVVGGVGGRGPGAGGLDLGFGPERTEPALAPAPWAAYAEALGDARGRRSGGRDARGARVPSGSEGDGGIHWKAEAGCGWCDELDE
jgi:hypothetical protein